MSLLLLCALAVFAACGAQANDAPQHNTGGNGGTIDLPEDKFN